MKPKLVILADDLSGAADCAAPFARSGFRTEVFLEPELAQDTSSPVISIDLNTRELMPGQAVLRTLRAVSLVPVNADTLWYRKIDSILRGNIGPDVLATVRGLRDKRIIICAPAFPDTGRTTVKGKVLVNRLPLEESGIRHRWPKSLSEIFSEVGLPTRLVPLDMVRSGPANLVEYFRSTSEVTVWLLDAETNDDLSIIAQAGLQIREEVVFVGSAGLAHQIAALSMCGPVLTREDLSSDRKLGSELSLTDKPILVVVGSKSEVSRTQFEHLSASAGIDFLRIPISALQAGNHPTIVDELNRAVASNRDLSITTEIAEPVNDQDGAPLMDTLGKTLKPFMEDFSALVLTGGETARGVLTQSAIGRLRLLDEIEPGITLSVSAGKKGIPIIMKAGAFGSLATLSNALHFLRSCKQ
jgi:uncharacterized protein YgbK (DUF1537 family)